MKLPADNLKDAFNACNPNQALPANDSRYVDLSPGRSDEGNPVNQCRSRILNSDTTPTCQLFAGHRGCGKSTELQRLKKTLEDDGYFVTYFDAEGDLDLEDTESTDIILSVIRNLEASMRGAEISLPKNLMNDFLLWFGEVVLETNEESKIEAEAKSEIRAGVEIPLLARFLSVMTGRVKTGTESKKLIRQRLDTQVSQLITRGNDLVLACQKALQKEGKKDLVIIVDSLDRIALKSRGDGRTSHEVLYIERGNLLRGFGCHVIYTVPVSLYFSPKQSVLRQLFPYQHLLPMIKIAMMETRKPWKKGRDLLTAMLEQRLILDKVFEKGVTEALIEACGGHPRELMILVQNALIFADVLPVTMKTAKMTVRRLNNDYDRSIPEEHWSLLAQVYLTQRVQNDTDHQLILHNLSVLEYQNADRWCDVHPAILELPRFKEALKVLQKRKAESEKEASH